MNQAEKRAQAIAIRENLQKTSAAVEEYLTIFDQNKTSTDLGSAGQISECHAVMIENVKQLQSAIYGPLNMVMLHYEECLRTSSLRTLVEMGVIDALPIDGSSISAKELAQKLEADEALIVRLMRVCIPTFFKEPEVEFYVHTANSKMYLDPSLKANFKMMFDEICTASMKMSEFYKKNGYLKPCSASNNPYTYAHDTKGLSIFEFILQDPVRLKNMNEAMKARSSQTSLPYHLFPFEERLSRFETTTGTVLCVDVGSGMGQATLAIREACHDIEGDMVMQDQQEVIDSIEHEIPAGVIVMSHDFFLPQPVRGALFYYIHRCLHDWPDSDCLVILLHLAAAMTPGVSRLLISEIVMPQGKVDIQTAWSDINMLTFGGVERTEKQWTKLLDEAGLSIAEIHGEEAGCWYRVLEVGHKGTNERADD